VDEREMLELEEQVPQVAVDALNAAHREAVASGLPLVMVIGDGLYRVSGTGERELIRMLPPRKKARDLAKRDEKS
jgi:hypothetical protein